MGLVTEMRLVFEGNNSGNPEPRRWDDFLLAATCGNSHRKARYTQVAEHKFIGSVQRRIAIAHPADFSLPVPDHFIAPVGNGIDIYRCELQCCGAVKRPAPDASAWRACTASCLYWADAIATLATEQ